MKYMPDRQTLPLFLLSTPPSFIGQIENAYMFLSSFNPSFFNEKKNVFSKIKFDVTESSSVRYSSVTHAVRARTWCGGEKARLLLRH